MIIRVQGTDAKMFQDIDCLNRTVIPKISPPGERNYFMNILMTTGNTVFIHDNLQQC